MALDLYTVKEDFASMVQRVQPWTLSQFVMWLDLKVAEYKVHGYMILDFEDRLSQFFNTDLRREMAASQQLKKQPSPKITPKRTAPSMQLSSRQSTSATSTANLECSQEPLNNLGSSINQGRTHDWLMPQHTVSQVSHGSEVAQKETSVPSRLCPTIVRPREINQVENDPVPRDSQMDLVMDVETEADNAGIDINWTNSATEPISGSSVYHKNSLVYHEESPSFKNPSTYSKETNDYRKETSEYSKETSSSSKSMRTNQSQQNSEESSHGKTNTEHCGLSLPVTEIKIEDFKNDEEENANENFTVTVENSSSSNSLVETNDYMRIEENSDSDTKEEKQETLQQDQPVMWQTGESSREPCCPCLNRGKCGSCCCKDTGCTSCVNSMCKFMGAQTARINAFQVKHDLQRTPDSKKMYCIQCRITGRVTGGIRLRPHVTRCWCFTCQVPICNPRCRPECWREHSGEAEMKDTLTFMQL